MGAAFSPDGRILATGDLGGNLILWDAASGVRVAGPLKAHDRGLGALELTDQRPAVHRRA
jgi:WD40 repeat protein